MFTIKSQKNMSKRPVYKTDLDSDSAHTGPLDLDPDGSKNWSRWIPTKKLYDVWRRNLGSLWKMLRNYTDRKSEYWRECVAPGEQAIFINAHFRKVLIDMQCVGDDAIKIWIKLVWVTGA